MAFSAKTAYNSTMRETLQQVATSKSSVALDEVAALVSRACKAEDYKGKRVLLIVPDGTRTAPIGLVFRALHEQIGAATKTLDVLIALGTHQPMSEEAICGRLEISAEERRTTYKRVQFFNHEWDNPSALKQIGSLSAAEASTLTNGLLAMDVPVEINKRLFDYDQVIIIGPV